MADKERPYDKYETKGNFVARLQNLVETWKEFVKPAMKHRKDLLKLAASGFYDLTKGPAHVLNLTDRGVSTIVPFLVEGNPRVLVDTQVTNYKSWAYTTTLALNYLIKKMKLAETVLIPAAINSMFGSAITRTDFYYDRLISLEDELIKLGTPRVELIDDVNYVGDPSAKRRNDFTFEGDIYTLPTDYARDFFSGKKGVNPDWITSDQKILQEFDPRDIVNSEFDSKMMSLRDYTTFVDIYLRDEGTIITILPKGGKERILREREWEGPGDGPYDVLGYQFHPDSPIPIPPAWKWYDMDVTANIVMDKLRELIENQKDIVGFSSENEEDVKRAIRAPNTGVIRQDNPNSLQKISLGGITDRSNWEYLQFVLTEQTKQGANPDVLGGRGASAPTLGQEQLVYQNATRVVGNMYNRFQDFMTNILTKLAWSFWTDPTLEVPVVKDIPGIGELPAMFSSNETVGDFYDFVFEIVPYSTQRTSPEMQYQKIMQLMSQWVLPTLQLAQMQGAELDIPEATQMLADYLGVKSFKQFYRTTIPKPGEMVPYQMQPSKNRKETGEGMVSDAFGTSLGNQMIQSTGQAQTEETQAMLPGLGM